MTDELRWILLGVGALLIVGLWLWESLRARRKPLADDAFNVTPPVQRPPTTTGLGGVYRANPPPPVSEPVWEEPRWSTAETDTFEVPDIHVEDELPPLEPPVVELPDHHAVESTAALPVITPAPSTYDRPRGEPAPVTPPPTAASPVAPPPTVRQPSPARSRPAAPPRQKIVALRLVGPTPAARFPGTALREALEAEGLTFGRYHIFHRETEDQKLLFSVASLIEPGSFELRDMGMQEFPGVSLFAVLPGAVEGTQVVDELVACARRLASRLGGVLQNERRESLTPLRAIELRDEVAAFDRALLSEGDDDGG